jgi:prephenate dehydrogenase
MTSTEQGGGDERSVHRVGVIGTGLIGTSIGLAARHAGCEVSGWDSDHRSSRLASERAGLSQAETFEQAIEGADLVVVATPIPAVAQAVARALERSPAAIVTDAGSVKATIVQDVQALAQSASLARFVPGHPMGGSERSGPEHASAALVDGIVWALTPAPWTSPAAVDRTEGWIAVLGATPVRLSPERHDRLVAFVSHLPQVASTALMGLAATEEAGEPEMLLLAAGGFRDLTRLAASDSSLWSEILVANRESAAEAIELYAQRLYTIRAQLLAGDSAGVERSFEEAKQARLGLAAKPRVRSGVAVFQVQIPDRPRALAQLTTTLGDAEVNIEDLQIVHSPEGGRGTVHITVAASTSAQAHRALEKGQFDPIRLA